MYNSSEKARKLSFFEGLFDVGFHESLSYCFLGGRFDLLAPFPQIPLNIFSKRNRVLRINFGQTSLLFIRQFPPILIVQLIFLQRQTSHIRTIAFRHFFQLFLKNILFMSRRN